MEKDKVQDDKVQSNDEISNVDLDKVAGGNMGIGTLTPHPSKFLLPRPPENPK